MAGNDKHINKNEKTEEELLNEFLDFDSEPKKTKEEKKEEKEILNLDLKNKEDIMKIIRCQDLANGYWDINNKTNFEKDKYENEFQWLKKLKNIDDNLAMTIIIAYFITKENKEFLDELLLNLKKAKSYIQDKAGDSYDNIINHIGSK